MQYLKLSKNKYAIVDDDDFSWAKNYKWSLSSHGYAVYTGKRKSIYLHSLINKTPKGKLTDHINRNKLDNRKINLRSADSSLNGFNKIKQSNNKSGVVGVAFDSNLWRAQIKFGKIRKSKYFRNKEEAISQRKVWEVQIAIS